MGDLYVTYIPETLAALLSVIALLVAFGGTRVKAATNVNNDRALELQMQGLYVEMSREDRAARDRLQSRHDELVTAFTKVQVQLTTVIGERDQLRLLLETSDKLHRAELAQMTSERDDLKRQIADLKEQVNGLKNRIDDVGEVAAKNQAALERERQAREKAERERDAAIAERDALQARVSELEAEVKALRLKLDEMTNQKDGEG